MVAAALEGLGHVWRHVDRVNDQRPPVDEPKKQLVTRGVGEKGDAVEVDDGEAVLKAVDSDDRTDLGSPGEPGRPAGAERVVRDAGAGFGEIPPELVVLGEMSDASGPTDVASSAALVRNGQFAAPPPRRKDLTGSGPRHAEGGGEVLVAETFGSLPEKLVDGLVDAIHGGPLSLRGSCRICERCTREELSLSP